MTHISANIKEAYEKNPLVIDAIGKRFEKISAKLSDMIRASKTKTKHNLKTP